MHAMAYPGPVFVECPVDLLYDEATIRQWYADAAGKGTSIADRLLRWYLNRHAARDVRAAAAKRCFARVRSVAAATAVGRGGRRSCTEPGASGR